MPRAKKPKPESPASILKRVTAQDPDIAYEVNWYKRNRDSSAPAKTVLAWLRLRPEQTKPMEDGIPDNA